MQSLLTIASWLTGSVIIVFARFVTAVRGIWQGTEPDQTQRVFFANHCSHVLRLPCENWRRVN